MVALCPYDPLNTPKPFGPDAWIVDGPEIRMDYGPVSLPFPTRMVVARLASGDLWVHSPIAPDPGLFVQIDALGPVRHLIAPNSLHHSHMADWLARYPAAVSHAVPGLHKAKRPFRIDRTFTPGHAMGWENEIDWVLVPGTAVTEAVFHIRHASLVVLTDLIENFERDRVKGRILRWLIGLAGADGSTPFDLRMTFWPRRKAVRAAVAEIVSWAPERVVMAHGRPYASDGAAQLRRGLRWAVPSGR